MSETSFNFFLIGLSIALTIFGSFVAAKLQRKNQEYQSFSQLREQKVSAALLTAQRVSKLIDRRLYRQRRLLWAVASKDKDRISLSLSEYQEILFEWMDNLGTIKSEIWASFDWYTMNEFESDIHQEFSRIGSEIEYLVRNKSSNGSILLGNSLDYLGYSSYRFTNQLLQRISSEDVRGLSGRFSISYKNAHNLSYSFLIRKILGLPVKEDPV